jgi:hypothetical protein
MTALIEDDGKRFLAAVGPIEVGRQIDAWRSLKNYILDGVLRTLFTMNDRGRPIRRQPPVVPQHLPELSAGLFFASFPLLDGLDAGKQIVKARANNPIEMGLQRLKLLIRRRLRRLLRASDQKTRQERRAETKKSSHDYSSGLHRKRD